MATYADRPWTKYYDPGIPASLDYPEVPVFALLDKTVREFPDLPAVVTSNSLPLFGRKAHTVTYKELGDITDTLAAGLAGLGIKKGTRVAVFEGEGNVILLKPLPDDPIEASRGMLKGETSLVKALLRDRGEEAKRG